MMTCVSISALLFACCFQASFDQTIDFRRVGDQSFRAAIPIRNLKAIGMVQIDANYAVTCKISKSIGDQAASLKLFNGRAGDGISLLDAIADERRNISVLVGKHVLVETLSLGLQVQTKLELFELAPTGTDEDLYTIVRQTNVVADGIDNIVQASFLTDGKVLFQDDSRIACLQIEYEGVSRVDWIDGYDTLKGRHFECPSFVRSLARSGYSKENQLDFDRTLGRVFVGRNRTNSTYYLQNIAQQWSLISKTENGESVVQLDGEPLAWDIDAESSKLALVLVLGDRLHWSIWETDSLKMVSSESLTTAGRASPMRLNLMLHPQGFLGVYW